jgi:hypothetical protein
MIRRDVKVKATLKSYDVRDYRFTSAQQRETSRRVRTRIVRAGKRSSRNEFRRQLRQEGY